MTTDLPTRARVVIVGGGVIGTSTAYHLTRLGWTDVLLLEQGSPVRRHDVARGRARRAAARVGERDAAGAVQRRALRPARGGDRLSAGYKRCGGVIVARTADRMTQLRRTAATADAYGLECAMMTPDEALARWPVMRVDDLLGAIWLPGDGKANPTDLTMALAKGARQRGARVGGADPRLDVLVRDGAVDRRPHRPRATSRPRSSSTAPASGPPRSARWPACTVPLHSAEHFYVVTDQVEGVHPDLPILRDPDGYTYFKEEVGGLVVGGFEPEAKPWVSPDQIPYPFEFALLDEDWDHFAILMDSALHRIPALAETGIRKFYNGPE